MRVEASTTSISWIPSEAVRGLTRLPFERGVAHYDEPPPDSIGPHGAALDELRDADRFRFANRLHVEVDFDGGRPVSWVHHGGGLIGSTTVRVRRAMSVVFEAVALDDLRPEPEIGDGWIRFTQSAGGRTGLPAPRSVRRPPFVQWRAPLAWSTLALTVHADGRSEAVLAGASPFPRHWLYDSAGTLIAKSGLVDFAQWYRRAFGHHSPWGDEDSAAIAAAVETALERELSRSIMAGDEPPVISARPAGSVLMRQGDEGSELMLILDGIVAVSVDGETLVELGPGAVIGERSGIEAGVRTATVTTVTECRTATVGVANADAGRLSTLADGHHRERARTTDGIPGT